MELLFCFLLSWLLVMRDATVDGVALIRGKQPPRHLERMARMKAKHATELARIKAGNPSLAESLARRIDQSTRRREAKMANPTVIGPLRQFTSAAWEDAWLRATDRWYDRRDRQRKGELPRQRAWDWLRQWWTGRPTTSDRPEPTDDSDPVDGGPESTADDTDPANPDGPDPATADNEPPKSQPLPRKCGWVFRDSGTLCSEDATYALGVFYYCDEHIITAQAEQEAARRRSRPRTDDQRPPPIHAEATRMDQEPSSQPEWGDPPALPAGEQGEHVMEVYDPRSAYADAMKYEQCCTALMVTLDSRLADLDRLRITDDPVTAYTLMKDAMATAIAQAQIAQATFQLQIDADDHLKATPGGGSGEYYGLPESGSQSDRPALVSG